MTHTTSGPPVVSYTNNRLLFSVFLFCFFHIFKRLFVLKEALVLSSFSFSPWRRFAFKPKYWANLFKYIFFCFVLLFTSSSPCCKDQFAVLWFSTSYYCIDPSLRSKYKIKWVWSRGCWYRSNFTNGQGSCWVTTAIKPYFQKKNVKNKKKRRKVTKAVYL